MATDANTLLAATQCYACLSVGEWQLLKLALLRQILLASNPMADTTPNYLLEVAKCYQCNGSPGMLQLFELGLLSQLVSAGASGSVLCGAGAPTTAPSTTSAVYTNTSTGQIYYYCNGAWNLSASSGGIQVFSGAADPVADPGVTPALYINTTTGILWQWYGGAWH